MDLSHSLSGNETDVNDKGEVKVDCFIGPLGRGLCSKQQQEEGSALGSELLLPHSSVGHVRRT